MTLTDAGTLGYGSIARDDGIRLHFLGPMPSPCTSTRCWNSRSTHSWLGFRCSGIATCRPSRRRARDRSPSAHKPALLERKRWASTLRRAWTAADSLPESSRARSSRAVRTGRSCSDGWTGASVPGPVDRDAVGGALTGREVGQEHFETSFASSIRRPPNFSSTAAHSASMRNRNPNSAPLPGSVEAAPAALPGSPVPGSADLEAQPGALATDEEAGVELMISSLLAVTK